MNSTKKDRRFLPVLPAYTVDSAHTLLLFRTLYETHQTGDIEVVSLLGNVSYFQRE